MGGPHPPQGEVPGGAYRAGISFPRWGPAIRRPSDRFRTKRRSVARTCQIGRPKNREIAPGFAAQPRSPGQLSGHGSDRPIICRTAPFFLADRDTATVYVGRYWNPKHIGHAAVKVRGRRRSDADISWWPADDLARAASSIL
jgi:hypothetical protein